MSLGIFCVREEALPLARLLEKGLGGTLYKPEKGGSARERFASLFPQEDAWVLLMACGIAVRFLHNLPRDKKSDPAVVVLDEGAHHAISLLSGHEGGANALAADVANLSGAAPVVTTATEALKPLVLGIGCRRGTSAEDIGAAVREALPAGRSCADIREAATVDLKADEPGLLQWCAENGLPLRVFPRSVLKDRAWTTAPSPFVREVTGLPGVCEPCALLASPRGALSVPKTTRGGVAVAFVEDLPSPSPEALPAPAPPRPKGGKLYLVSVGPGVRDYIVPRARQALEESSDVVSYDLYLRWVAPWIVRKTLHRLPLTQEKERAQKALDLAREGKVVSLVSSGDIGVYAMASLAFELMEEEEAFPVEVVPGVTAATSCGSLLGAPLAHDFAALSLSDLLCPWRWIEERARAVAQADLCVALYNVQSRSRQEGVYKILDILLEKKQPSTLCGIVRNACREGQETDICTLAELRERRFDMLTTLLIGNRFTERKGPYLYTPRGYLNWREEPLPEAPSGAVWVFAGTRDGTALAAELAAGGFPVVVSTATEYGGETARASLPEGVAVVSGRLGAERRRRLLEQCRARAVVDATHPYAVKISRQLSAIAEETGIPFLRYERPACPPSPDALYCADMEAAAAEAAARGTRIFLSTGIRDLETFLQTPGADAREWFLRIPPDERSLESALGAGVPRRNLCLMQGPFSKDFNVALWRSWGIDCVVSKESGPAGGVPEKLAAARELEIPCILVRRPEAASPRVVDSAAAAADFLKETC